MYFFFSYHLVNVFLHILVTLELWVLAKFILGLKDSTSFLCALTFAVHPIHTEAVAGVVGRADLLATLFFLASFACYSKHLDLKVDQSSQKKCWMPLVLSIVLCLLSMLSKEHGLTVLAVCVFYELFLRSGLRLSDILRLRFLNEVG